MADTIWLSGISAHAHHGVFTNEKVTGQRFVLDVGYELDTRAAARDDDVTRAVSYADVATAVHAALTGPAVDLIETLAERLARVVLGFADVDAVTVVVHKPQAPLAVPFQDVTLTIRRTRTTVVPAAPVPVVLGLGGNLGDVRAALSAAVRELGSVVADLRVATAVRTEAMRLPGTGPQPDYWNTVVVGTTRLAATELLAACQAVELAHGRVRHERWGARTLDVDIVAYGDLNAETDTLVLPHPGAGARSFVTVPWAELQPDAVWHGQCVAALAAQLRSEIKEASAL